VLNDTQDRLTMSIQINGLDLGGQTTTTTDDVTAAHIHAGAVGVPGGVVWGFIGTPQNDTAPADVMVDAIAGTVTAAWDAGEGNGTTLTAQLAALLAGNLYLNFHTSAFSAGAIRGQIIAAVPEPGALALLAGGLASFAWRRRRAR
jgi:hypothetical protein